MLRTVVYVTSPDAVDDGHRLACQFEVTHIKRRRKQHAPLCVDKMTTRQVSPLSASLDQHLPLAGRDRLGNDLCRVPVLGACSVREGKQHRSTVCEHLRAKGPLACAKRHNAFRCPTVWRHAKDAFVPLREENSIRTPAQSEPAHLHGAECDSHSTSDIHSLEKPIGEEHNRLTVW